LGGETRDRSFARSASFRDFSVRSAVWSFWVSWSLRRRVWRVSDVIFGFEEGIMRSYTF
jgi:hypothetical protein